MIWFTKKQFNSVLNIQSDVCLSFRSNDLSYLIFKRENQSIERPIETFCVVSGIRLNDQTSNSKSGVSETFEWHDRLTLIKLDYIIIN